MRPFPKIAVIGPVGHSGHGWYYLLTTCSISDQLTKSTPSYSIEQEAVDAAGQLKASLEESGYVVFMARTFEDRDASLSFIRQVTEFVTSEDAEDE